MQAALVAGETSGDLLAGLLLDGLKQRWPELQSVGIGGPQMAQRGFEAWWPHDKLAVHGFGWEVLRRYREIVGIRSQLQTRLLQSPPDVFIGVDAPDFNLDLEAALKAQGIKTVHFVCPSIWAWRPERVEKIKHSVDHVLCIFPFEPALLAAHGIAATYVGHPLANVITMQPDQAAARARLGLSARDAVVAILPGSRESEIRHLATHFFEAARLIRQARPDTKFIVPVVPARRAQIEAALQASGMADQVQLVAGQSHTVLAACDVTLIASGTATLEAALFKRPMVITYKVPAITAWIARGKLYLPYVGLPNILLGRFAVPELLQENATPDKLAEAVLGWLDAPEKCAALAAEFRSLHETLRCNAGERIAEALEPYLL